MTKFLPPLFPSAHKLALSPRSHELGAAFSLLAHDDGGSRETTDSTVYLGPRECFTLHADQHLGATQTAKHGKIGSTTYMDIMRANEHN